MDPAQEEQRLLARPLPDLLPTDEGWVMPHYDGLSIANLPSTIASLLGCDLDGALPALSSEIWESWIGGVRRIVLILLDGLGYRMLQAMRQRGEGRALGQLAEAGRLHPLTSVFPSTTDAALLSLGTGRSPAEHGWLAYTMYLREAGMAANAMLLSPMPTMQPDMLVDWGLEPEELVPAPPLASSLGTAGVATHALVPHSFLNAGFTQMLYRGVTKLHGYHQPSDMWTQLRQLLAGSRDGPAFISAYWGGLDDLGHAYGHNADAWEAEFRSIDHFLGRELLDALPAQDREGTLLLITSDHGQLLVPTEGIVTANEEPQLLQHLLVPIVGESRAAFVYPRPGRAQHIRDYLANRYPGCFEVVSSSDALDAGLMGEPVGDEAYARAGELLILPRGSRALQHAKLPVPLVSRHGGLTQEEMLVPLIGARLDDT